MVLQLCEITAGLVVLLDPEVFAEYGGRTDLPDEYKISGPHLFVCLDADDSTSTWAALTSKPKDQRIWIPTDMKLGDPRWIERNTYLAHPHQVWFGPNYAAVEASQGEGTPVRSRNSIHLEFIDTLVQVCRMP